LESTSRIRPPHGRARAHQGPAPVAPVPARGRPCTRDEAALDQGATPCLVAHWHADHVTLLDTQQGALGVQQAERPSHPDIDAIHQPLEGPRSPQVTAPLTTLNVTLALANVIPAPHRHDRRGAALRAEEGVGGVTASPLVAAGA
jgi:hypothetical protein